MSSSILITGATGNVGSEIIKMIDSGSARNFRIALRDVADIEKMRRKFGPDFGVGCDLVAFDFLKPDTFDAAFAGIEQLFLVRPPALSNVPRDIAPALQAAVHQGVKHIVFLSLQGVEQNRMTPHYKIEQLLQSMAITYTFLRASFFMQNLSTTEQVNIRDHDEIPLPVGKAKTAFVDVRDIAAIALTTLTQPGHQNKKYTLTGSVALDYFEVAEIMSTTLGRTIRYTNPFVGRFLWQQLRLGQSLAYALVVSALYTITRFGNAQEVTNDVGQLLGRPPISFGQFATDNRACWIAPVTAKTL